MVWGAAQKKMLRAPLFLSCPPPTPSRLPPPRSKRYSAIFPLSGRVSSPPCTHPLALTQGQGSRARWEWGGVVEEDLAPRLAGAVIRGGEERSALGRFVGGEEG
jgi:hypothetical protein